MGTTIRQVKRRIKSVVQEIFKIFPEYQFIPAPSISNQVMNARFNGLDIRFEADYTTPLYETIAEVVDYDCYQLSRLNLGKNHDGIVLDIGANIGVTALLLAKVHTGRVICYEPLAANCEMLKRNCAHNGVKNVEIVQKAITSHTGTISFEVENDVSVSARVASPSRTKLPGLTTIEVEAVSFVDVFKSLAGKTIELIKLDCEGSEYDIIAQIDREMAGSIRALTFEIHNIDKLHNLESMVEKMHSLGYQVHTMKDIFGRRSLNHLLATY